MSKAHGQHPIAALTSALILVLVSANATASWDVLAQDFPPVDTIDQIPDDFIPQPLGSRAELMARIQRRVPALRFGPDGLGCVTGTGLDLEINVGKQDPVDSIAFHGRGGSGDIEVIADVLDALHLRAIDSGTGEFFSRSAAQAAQREWREHRNAVIEGTP